MLRLRNRLLIASKDIFTEILPSQRFMRIGYSVAPKRRKFRGLKLLLDICFNEKNYLANKFFK